MVVKHEYFVGYQYVDEHFKIKNSALLGMFEDLACIHGACAGEDIRTSETVWLLTAYKIRVIRRPEYAEYVTVHTWSRSLRGFLALREFEVRSADGELLVCALSEWVRVNKTKAMFERVPPEIAEAYGTESEHANFEETKLRAPAEPERYDTESEWTVTRSWIDANRHMNNVHYVELAEMAIPDSEDTELADCDFEVYYTKEIKCNECVRCHYAKTADGLTVVIKSEDGVTTHATVRFLKK